MANVAEVAVAERSLADLAAAITTGPHRGGLTPERRTLLVAVSAAHRQHVVALDSADPTTRPITPAPVASAHPPAGFDRLTLAQSLSLLTAREKAQAARLRPAAIQAEGFEALVWGSMSVAAGTCAGAVSSAAAVPTSTQAEQHSSMTAVSDVEAVQSMVRQLQAIVYGYQMALGHLSQSSPAGLRARASLRDHRLLRDRLVRSLMARSASVPPAAGAYVPSVDPTTPARASRLIRRMETALQPFCGLWLASATTAGDRVLALDTLTRTVATARTWNAPLTVWPGWQD